MDIKNPEFILTTLVSNSWVGVSHCEDMGKGGVGDVCAQLAMLREGQSVWAELPGWARPRPPGGATDGHPSNVSILGVGEGLAGGCCGRAGTDKGHP